MCVRKLMSAEPRLAHDIKIRQEHSESEDLQEGESNPQITPDI